MKRARAIGQKIFLRPLERSDLTDAYLDWVNEPEIIGHILASRMPVTREALEEYYDKSQTEHCVMFAICDKENGLHIGNARLSSIDWTRRVALYGRLIGNADYRGKGYGSDALIQLLRFGFHQLGLNRIQSIAVIENEISLGSNDKVGMTREGILREFFYVDGKFLDGVQLAMLRADFDNLHGAPKDWAEKQRQKAGA